jgi:hypothetical protein
MVHNLGDTMKREDCHQWLACANKFSKLPLVKDVPATAVDSDQNDGTDEPGRYYVQYNVPALTSELGSDTRISPLHGAVVEKAAVFPDMEDLITTRDCVQSRHGT